MNMSMNVNMGADAGLSPDVNMDVDVNVLLFDGFETLDAFGPVEVLGRVGGYRMRFLSHGGGTAASAQGVPVATEPAAPFRGVLLVPGGQGTRTLVDDGDFLELLRGMAERADFCLSVCTGSALLGRCGALDGRRATSNKRAMEWVRSVRDAVRWVDEARWVVDGKFYTSSGISAGMDMALGFAADRHGRERALEAARRMEYLWNEDSARDPFARKNAAGM